MCAALLGSSPRLDKGRSLLSPAADTLALLLGPGLCADAGGPLDGGRARAVLDAVGATGPLDGGRSRLFAPAGGDTWEPPRGPSVHEPPRVGDRCAAPSPRAGGLALCDNLGGVACSCPPDHDEGYPCGGCTYLRFVLGGVLLSCQSVETRASCSDARSLLRVPAGVPVGVLVGVCM